MITLARDYFQAPFTTLELVASARGLRQISFVVDRIPPAQLNHITSHAPLAALRHLEHAKHELGEYFAGQRTEFSLELDVSVGTEFQRQVWQVLRTIPYGQVISYQEVAVQISNPKAVRAVGNANGKNPLPIVVPCHRVVAKSGMGGYSSGIELKLKLLKHEQVTI